MKTFLEKVSDGQVVEKSGLIIAGTTIIPVGVVLVEKDTVAGIVVILIGVACLIAREVLKVK